ncbi:MAG: DUF4157 domain-containing protein [Niabella sp.]
MDVIFALKIAVTIKENAWVARMAAKKLRSHRMAIVFGRTIYLHGVSRGEFLGNTSWLRHELKHVEQYQRYGFFMFLAKYLWQSLRHGYYRCGLECEARAAEGDLEITDRYFIE